MSDLGIMDYFLSKTNDKVDIKVDPDMEMTANYDNPEMMSSDFFDSILSLERTNLEGCDLDSGLFDNLEIDVNLTSDGSVTYDDMQCETSTFSDSGLSSDLQDVSDQILSDDELLKSILDAPVPNNVQQPSAPQVSAKPVEYVRPLVSSVHPAEQEKPKIINIIKPVQKSKQVIRVQPLNGNSRSVLLPINIKDLKTIKIINTNNLKAENIKFTSAPVRTPKKVTNEKYIIKPTRKIDVEERNEEVQRRRQQPATMKVEDCVEQEEGSASQYPPLMLTPEEKRLLSKDGIQLPCRYPLTKHEERELKRIRRKIRNKISAQDSRKRKKEYVDGLEERVKQCSEENRSLVKRIKLLQLQNNKLSSQLSKLQALVFKTGSSRAHPATCLMIVLLSVMLVTLPNLRSNSGGAVDKELNTLQQYVARRALLFSRQATNEDTASLNMDELITFNKKEEDNSQEIIDALEPKNEKSPTNYDIFDSFQSDGIDYDDHGLINDGGGGDDGNYLTHGTKRYLEPDVDDYWPPQKKKNVSVSATQHVVDRTEYYE